MPSPNSGENRRRATPIARPSRVESAANPEARTADWPQVEDEWVDQWPTMPVPSLGIDAELTMPLRALPPRRFPRQGPSRPAASSRRWPQEQADDDVAIDLMPTWVMPAIPSGVGVSDLPTRSQRVAVVGAESYVQLLRNLATTSGIFALATMASPLVSLVLGPYITHNLSLNDYGILAIINTFIGLAAGITQLGLGSAFFRAYTYDYSARRDQLAVVATITLLLALGSALAAGIIFALSPSLAGVLFQQSSLGSLVALAAGIVVLQNLTVPGFAWLRAENRARTFTALSIGNVLVSLVCTVLFLGVLQQGIRGVLLATAAGYVFVALCTLPVILLRAGLRLRTDVAKNVLSFGIPLVLNFTSFWVLQLSDRFLLARLVSFSQAASYTVAYTLGSVLATAVLTPFTLAWPTALFTIAKRRDAPEVFRLLFRWFSLLLLFAAFGLSIAARMVLDWFFPAKYHAAAPIIPIVSASLVFYGVYYVFMAGVNIRRKTWMAGVFTTIAGLYNVGLNLVLIPAFQGYGAAASTLLAYIVMAAVAYTVNQRLYPVRYEVGRFVLALLVGISMYAGTYALTKLWGQQWVWQASLLGLVAFTACLFTIGGVSDVMALRQRAGRPAGALT
jgi:O-antigen/teichoic acid export membrane protein